MDKKDLLKIAKWMGYVYAPIALLVIGIFILVQFQAHAIEKARTEASPRVSVETPRAATTSVPATTQ